jgi:hypothetical protein
MPLANARHLFQNPIFPQPFVKVSILHMHLYVCQLKFKESFAHKALVVLSCKMQYLTVVKSLPNDSTYFI